MTTFWGVLVVGILTALGVGALATAGLAAVWWSRSLSSGASTASSTESVLEDLGYEAVGVGQWRMRMARTDLEFEQPDGGWRWKVTLPRYNTLTLRVEERSNASRGTALGEVFQTQNPEIDGRFEVSSPLPAQTLALLMDHKVVGAMVDMPFLSFTLQGDEMTIVDPGRKGLSIAAKRAGGRSPEVEVHRSVVALVMAVLGALYARGSGTLLPQHR